MPPVSPTGQGAGRLSEGTAHAVVPAVDWRGRIWLGSWCRRLHKCRRHLRNKDQGRRAPSPCRRVLQRHGSWWSCYPSSGVRHRLDDEDLSGALEALITAAREDGMSDEQIDAVLTR